MKRPQARRRVGSYQFAITWIALNDDTLWLDDEDGSPSVTLTLVADIFQRTVEQATADLRRALERERQRPAREKAAQESLEQARAHVRSVIANLPGKTF